MLSWLTMVAAIGQQCLCGLLHAAGDLLGRLMQQQGSYANLEVLHIIFLLTRRVEPQRTLKYKATKQGCFSSETYQYLSCLCQLDEAIDLLRNERLSLQGRPCSL